MTGPGVARTASLAAACLAAALLLSACSLAKGRELPDNGADGTLKPSPCACVGIEDYDGGGFEWKTG